MARGTTTGYDADDGTHITIRMRRTTVGILLWQMYARWVFVYYCFDLLVRWARTLAAGRGICCWRLFLILRCTLCWTIGLCGTV